MQNRANVELVGIEEHAHFGLLRCRLTTERLRLHKAARDRRGLPAGLIECTVDADAAARADGARAPARVRGPRGVTGGGNLTLGGDGDQHGDAAGPDEVSH